MKERVKNKALRNKTIDFELDSDEGREYRKRCLILAKDKVKESEILDQVILGDCLQVMDRLPRAFADLLIVDPPYNLAKDYHGNQFLPKSFEMYREYTTQWLEKALPLLKPTGSIYVCCDWKSSLVIGEVLHERIKVQNRITWQREKGRGAKANWKNGMEDVWFGTMGSKYTFNLDAVMVRRKVIAPYKVEGVPKDWEETEEGNFRNTCPSNFWDDISIPYWSMPENTAHPTQKPEKLIAKLILASSNKGDVILDPFGGSGTTAVTAKKLGRHFVTIEQNELYCAWAQKRLEMASEDPAIQGYQDGIFWERNSWSQQKKKHLGGEKHGH
ncbi:MAG: site-specific DNA-methyltransferase [Lachnospiraceae bacterium]|nr:site-specific DNA-methyltransferase [Lachnospiraceae bacterium]